MHMGRRSKTGCITCRIRRVKCDETKPECRRCQAARRICDGYLPDAMAMPRRQLAQAVQNLSVVGPISRALSPLAIVHSHSSDSTVPGRHQELIFFDLFRQSTTPRAGKFSLSSLWYQQLLQLAHTEPAIWHATVSIGALHHNLELEFSGGTNTDDALVQAAARHYGKAMELAKNLNSPSKVFALSIALISSANLLYHFSDISTHLIASLKMLQDSRLGDLQTSHFAEVLVRMDMQAMTFSDSQSPYPYVEAFSVRGVDNSNGMFHEAQDIASYARAASILFVLLRRVLLLDECLSVGRCSLSEFHTQLATITTDLESWEQKMSILEDDWNRDYLKPGPRDDDASIAGLSIRFCHVFLRLAIKHCFRGEETCWDAYLAHMERLASLGAAIARLFRERASPRLSLEPGVISLLFFVAHRCRHPVLRRRALVTLQRLRRQEGSWRSDGAAKVIEQVILTEETAARALKSPIQSTSHSPSGNSSRGGEQDAATWPLDAASLDGMGCMGEPTDEEVDELLAVPWHNWVASNFRPPSTLRWDSGENPVPRIPAAARVKVVLVCTEFGKRQIRLRLLMNPADPSQLFGPTVDSVVSF